MGNLGYGEHELGYDLQKVGYGRIKLPQETII